MKLRDYSVNLLFLKKSWNFYQCKKCFFYIFGKGWLLTLNIWKDFKETKGKHTKKKDLIILDFGGEKLFC